MRLKTVVLIVAALALAGVTAVFVRNWLEAERAAVAAMMAKQKQPARVGTQVLVAKSDLAVGQFVRPDNLRWQPWPEGGLSPSYIVEGRRPLEDFVGAVVRLPIAAGEPITEGRVVSPGNSGFLAAVLRPGYRAVSVPVTVTSVIAGFVFPGDYVDLILTHTLPKQADERMERRAGVTVLRNIRVLALDQKLDMKPGENAVARTATLEVTPKQSEVIAVVVDMGKLSMSLRSLVREDDGKPRVNEAGAEIERAPDQPKEKTFTLDSEVSGLVSSRTVTVVRGGKTDEVSLPVTR